MKTIILPGYSPRNRQWAVETAKELNLGHEIVVYEWEHWTSGKSMSIKREIERIKKEVGKKDFNIIGKSVGTRVALRLAAKIPDQINKIILCGIPTKGESGSAKKNYAFLAELSPTGVLVFQNSKDPFADYQSVKKFVGSINSKIRVIEKPGNKHHYPYSKDFEKFLKAS